MRLTLGANATVFSRLRIDDRWDVLGELMPLWKHMSPECALIRVSPAACLPVGRGRASVPNPWDRKVPGQWGRGSISLTMRDC